MLEELALSGIAGHGSHISRLGVRDLAARLGLSKDTAARGLGRLLAAGIVVRVVERDGASGRFGAARYDITLPDGIAMDASRAVSASSVFGESARSRSKTRAVNRTTSLPRQLTLLALDVTDG